jgi:hypothetical protein
MENTRILETVYTVSEIVFNKNPPKYYIWP